MSNETIKLDVFKVTIGKEVFDVTAEDNLSARYHAAELFKAKYNLTTPLFNIVKHAKAKLVSAFEPYETTEEVLEDVGRPPKV